MLFVLRRNMRYFFMRAIGYQSIRGDVYTHDNGSHYEIGDQNYVPCLSMF